MYKPDKPKSKPLPVSTGSNISECTVCKEVFTSPSMFDKHLKRVSWKEDKYRMICVDPASVGMEIGARGYWTVPNDKNKWWEQQ